MSRLRVTYERNPRFREDAGPTDPDSHEPRLFATLDLAGFGADTVIAGLPIRFRRLARPMGSVLQVYTACLAGLTLERGNLPNLEATLDLYLGALIHYGRLPEYLFRVGDRAWPIYRLSDQLVSRYPGAPVFGAATIGELRLALADWFKLTGRIPRLHALEVLALSRQDMQLYRPLCAFRAPGMADVPAFPLPAAGDAGLVVPAGTRPLVVPLEGGAGILAAHRALADRLSLTEPARLSVRKLGAPAWAALAERLTPDDHRLEAILREGGRSRRQALPVYRAGDRFLVARPNRTGRLTVLIAPRLDALRAALGAELVALGKVATAGAVSVRRERQTEGQPFAAMARSSLLARDSNPLFTPIQ